MGKLNALILPMNVNFINCYPISYTDDLDLNDKLSKWEHFYNFNRPHGTFKEKTPYEVLKDKLKN